jgi:SAM-dependent methyltransferase
MKMNCRICGGAAVVEAGQVEYVEGYKWSVYDCKECGCRFTRHDDSVHELMHTSGAVSYYSEYRDLAQQCRSLFEAGDLEGLRAFLGRSPKYRFIIDQLAKEPSSARLLELGCSRGYVTSCFILEGWPILGVDVSVEAIAAANTAFGEHFKLSNSPEVAAGAPYDIIYHLGMIGCVADPVGLNRHLLSLLRPGGKLMFNAPNRRALHLRGQLWLDSAPPPDLVTLFPPGFWQRWFSNEAAVSESMDPISPEQSLPVVLRKMLRRRWQSPVPQPMSADQGQGRTWTQRVGPVWSLFERAVCKLARITGIVQCVPPQPAEFGLMVTMTKN